MPRIMPALRLLTLSAATAAALLAGCSKKEDPIVQAQKQEAPASAAAPSGPAVPSIAEVKAIAEEGFIYGLPRLFSHRNQPSFPAW